MVDRYPHEVTPFHFLAACAGAQARGLFVTPEWGGKDAHLSAARWAQRLYRDTLRYARNGSFENHVFGNPHTHAEIRFNAGYVRIITKCQLHKLAGCQYHALLWGAPYHDDKRLFAESLIIDNNDMLISANYFALDNT